MVDAALSGLDQGELITIPALPDAAEFGDEGSNTLGNVAKAVGGLDLPTLEALGLGNVEPLEGCPPQPGASPRREGATRAKRRALPWRALPCAP